MHPSSPPFRPISAPVPEQAVVDGPTVALRVAMVVLAVVAIVGLTALGFIVGLVWSFGACFKQQCSDVDAAAIVLLPIVGLAAGLAAAVGFRVKRAWFYRRPLVVWIPTFLIATWFALALASRW